MSHTNYRRIVNPNTRKTKMQTAILAKPETTFRLTSEEWCDKYKMLDILYNTVKNSPLHHDRRCKAKH